MIIQINTEDTAKSNQLRLQTLATLIKEVGYTMEEFTSAYLIARGMQSGQQPNVTSNP